MQSRKLPLDLHCTRLVQHMYCPPSTTPPPVASTPQAPKRIAAHMSVDACLDLTLQGRDYCQPSVWVGTAGGHVYTFPIEQPTNLEMPVAGDSCTSDCHIDFVRCTLACSTMEAEYFVVTTNTLLLLLRRCVCSAAEPVLLRSPKTVVSLNFSVSGVWAFWQQHQAEH